MTDPTASSGGMDDDELDIDDRRPATTAKMASTTTSTAAPTGGGLASADSKQVEQALKDVQLTPDSSGAIPQATIIDPVSSVTPS
jgi:hypothetical protein